MLSPTKPSPVKSSSWKFRCLAMLRGISSWRTHQTFRDWHIHNPSWWRHEDKTSHRCHTPSVPHYPPDMSQFHPGPGPRRPSSRGSFLGRPGHSERDRLRELGPAVWWPSIIIVKYVSFWGEKNKNWKETKNISNQNRKKGEKTILQ